MSFTITSGAEHVTQPVTGSGTQPIAIALTTTPQAIVQSGNATVTNG